MDVAARFLPLIARESQREFDPWAVKWLVRWLTETPAVTIEQAVEVVAVLADLPSEPVTALDAIMRAC